MLIKRLISAYIIFLLISAGFFGFLIFEDISHIGPVSAGTIRYVGNDQTYTKVQDAIDAAEAGDTIRVYAGIYKENIYINKSLTIQGNSSTNTIFECCGAGSVINLNASWVNLTGFSVKNGSYDGISIPNINSYSNNITISHLNIITNGLGINASHVHDLEIVDCNITNNSDYGIAVDCSNRVIISNNTLINNTNQITLISSSDCKIYSNNITTGYCGIEIDSGAANEIVGNEISSNYYGISLSDTKGIIENNLLETNSYCGIKFYKCTFNRIDNVTINGSSYLIIAGTSSDITISNSSLNKGFIPIHSNTYLTLLNTTLRKHGFMLYEDTATIIIQWYLHVTVKSEKGIPVPNAEVLVRNNTGAKLDIGTTDSNGKVQGLRVTEYSLSRKGIINNTPQNITAYNATMIGWAVPEPSIYKNQNLTIILDRPIPEINYVRIEEIQGKPVNGLTYFAGYPMEFYAVGYNNTMGSFKRVEAEWSVNNLSVATVTTGPSTTTTFTPICPGSCKITASYGTLPAATASVTIIGIVYNVNKNSYYGMIQHAINEANTGDTINLLNWTFKENIIIDKSLSINGLGTKKTILKGEDTGSIIKIKSSWVRLSNFTVTEGSSHGIYMTWYNPELHNITISNLTISNNKFDGISASHIYDLNISDCDINFNNKKGITFDNVKRGIILKNHMVRNIDHIEIRSSTSCKIFSNNMTLAITGIQVSWGNGHEIKGNRIIWNRIGISFYNTNDHIVKDEYINNIAGGYYSISINKCSNIRLINLTLVSPPKNSVIFGDCTEITIENSTLGIGIVEFAQNSDLLLINTTFNKGVRHNYETSSLTVIWYLCVKVLTNWKEPVPNAEVTIKDAFNKTIYSGTADDNGYCKQIACKEFTGNISGRVYYTPHNITGVGPLGTGYPLNETFIDSYKTIEVVIFDRIPPTADAGPDRTVDQHDTVTFNGTSSIDNVKIWNWTWTFNTSLQPVTLYGPNPSFVFHDAGKYNVTLTVRDSINMDTDNMTVTVRDSTAPLADAGKNITVDQFETVTFNGTGSSDNVGILNWTWIFEYDGTIVKLYESSPEFTFNIAGEYKVILSVTDKAGNKGNDFIMVYVGDIESPVADAGPDKSIDQHESVTFNGTGSTDNMGASNWTWTFEYKGIKVRLYGPSPSFTFHTAGKYVISLKVFDDKMNWAEDNMTVTVIDIIVPVADADTDITIGQYQNVTFDGTKSTDNVGISNWTWSFEDAGQTVILYGPTPSFIFYNAGTFPVTLKVTDLAGNWAEDTVYVTVIDLAPPVADAGPDLNIYQNQTVKLDGSGSWDNTGIINWSWKFQFEGRNIKLYGPIVEWNFTIIGNYTILLTVMDTMGYVDTDAIWINVTEDPSKVDDIVDDLSPADEDETSFNMVLAAAATIIAVILIIVIVTLLIVMRKKSAGKISADEKTVEAGTDIEQKESPTQKDSKTKKSAVREVKSNSVKKELVDERDEEE